MKLLLRSIVKKLIKPVYNAFMWRIDARIERLLLAVKSQFDDFDVKLENINIRFNTVDEKIDTVNTKLDTAAVKHDETYSMFDIIDVKLNTNDIKTDAAFDNAYSKLDTIDIKTDIVSTKLNDTGVKLDISNAKLDTIDIKTDIVSTKLDDTGVKLDISNAKLNEADTKIEAINTDLNKQSSSLENKITAFAISTASHVHKVWLVGTHDYSNVGDVIITHGERNFIHKYFGGYMLLEIKQRPSDEEYAFMRRSISSGDLIFCSGGGNLGNLYGEAEVLRRRIVSDFPEHLVVIMPQTIYFTQDGRGHAELSESRTVYNRHKNLLMFLRGEESLTFAQLNFPSVKSHSFPDMGLILRYDFGIERKGILTCIRRLNDESGLDEDGYNQVFNIVKDFDPEYKSTDNILDYNFAATIYDASVMFEHMKNFAQAEIVVTDRLHGAIISVITGTPCVLFKARTQKIREFAPFLKQTNMVIYLDTDVSGLPAAIENAYALKSKLSNFDSRFDEMAEIIKARKGSDL